MIGLEKRCCGGCEYEGYPECMPARVNDDRVVACTRGTPGAALKLMFREYFHPTLMRPMKILALVICVMIMVVPSVVLAVDSKEVLTLKRDLTNERVLRMTTQRKLMQLNWVEIEKALPILREQLKQYNQQLETMEAEKPTGKVEDAD